MIPRTYPSIVENGLTKMIVHFITDVTGMKRWVDYVPVKTVTPSLANRNTYNTGGAITSVAVATSLSNVAWKDYVPVFNDPTAFVPWTTNNDGYIPLEFESVTPPAVTLIYNYSTPVTSTPPLAGQIIQGDNTPNKLTVNYLDINNVNSQTGILSITTGDSVQIGDVIFPVIAPTLADVGFAYITVDDPAAGRPPDGQYVVKAWR